MPRLAFMMSGPKGGQVVEMDDEDFVQAQADGWVVDFQEANTGNHPDPFAGHNTKPHPQAEAWLAKRGSNYPTREMRAEPSSGQRAKPTTGPEPDEPAEPAKSTSGDKEDEDRQADRKAQEQSKPRTGDKPKSSPAKK